MSTGDVVTVQYQGAPQRFAVWAARGATGESCVDCAAKGNPTLCRALPPCERVIFHKLKEIN